MASWLTVGHTGDIPPDTVKVAEMEGRRMAICHVEGEGFFAIEDVCTHDGGVLDQGELMGHEIECPRHGARFDVRTGKVLCLPAVRPVPTYPLRVVGEEIQVAAGEETASGVRRPASGEDVGHQTSDVEGEGSR